VLGEGRCSHSSRVTRRDFCLSASKTAVWERASSPSKTFRFASALSRKERLSKFVEPTETQRSSTIMILQWYIVGWYS